MIIGDFNIFRTKWMIDKETNLLMPDITTARDQEQVSIAEISKWGYNQINHKSNNNGSFLDLVFVTNKSNAYVSDSPEIDQQDRNSHHHNLILLQINIQSDISQTKKRIIKNYNK